MKKVFCKTRASGFTLIELLTVIAIIAILAALLFPAIKSSLVKAEKAKAQTAIAGLSTAFRAYYTEYGKWPVGINDNLSSNVTYLVDSNVVALLQGFDNTASVTMDTGLQTPIATLQGNPRKIAFLEFKQQDLGTISSPACIGCFLDPWKQPYRFRLDVGYYNSIEDPFVLPHSGVFVYQGFLVWSVGPDGQADTSGDLGTALNKDNVKSW